MDQTLIFWTMVGMGIVTYLPRLLPTLFLSGRSLHPVLAAWLRLVPAAVLSAMLVPSLFIRDEQVNLGFNNLFLWSAIIVLPVAWKTRSLSVTVLVGMALVALGRFWGIGQ